jgi:glycosyltransferase involved in cell wall biosynthesis
MRVLTIGSMYPPHHLGGYELVWQSAVGHLRSAGHEVRVLTTDHREGEVGSSDASEESRDVHRQLRWYWCDHEFPKLSFRARLSLERQNAATMKGHLAEFRPEVVNWWAMGGMSLSLIERVRRAGIPAAGVVCDDWMLYGPQVDGWSRLFSRHGWLAMPVERITGIPARLDLSAAGPWLFPSETVRRTALEAGLDPHRTEVAHQGVDHDLFRAAPMQPWRWHLLYVGRIDARKGIDLAILALGELPKEAGLTIVGGGDDGYLDELKRLAREIGVSSRVSFTRVAHRSLPAIYADADVVLFPVRWREPWGLVPLEAMAVGTPVVASGRGGSGEYLKHGENCLLADPDDGAGALARSIDRLAGDADLRSRIYAGGLRTSGRFSAQSFDVAVERLLEQALNERRP